MYNTFINICIELLATTGEYNGQTMSECYTRHISHPTDTSRTYLITGHGFCHITNGWMRFGPLNRPEYITFVSMGMIWKYFRGHMFSQINL